MIYEVVRDGEVIKVRKCTCCLKYKRVEAFYRITNVNRCKVCLADDARKRRARKKLKEC